MFKRKFLQNWKNNDFTLIFEIDRILKRVVNAQVFFLFVCFLCCPQFNVKKKEEEEEEEENKSIDDEEKKRLTRFRSLFPTMMKRCNMMSVRKEKMIC